MVVPSLSLRSIKYKVRERRQDVEETWRIAQSKREKGTMEVLWDREKLTR